MLEDILHWSDDKLETGHDYVQILFPLVEPSQHVPNAPVLDAGTLAEFQKNATIKNNLLRSLQMMLRFYGFHLDTDKHEIVATPDFHVKSTNWLFVGDHNHLRITRILKCLSACGLDDQAAAFLKALLAIAARGKVSEETISYWKHAVSSEQER